MYIPEAGRRRICLLVIRPSSRRVPEISLYHWERKIERLPSATMGIWDAAEGCSQVNIIYYTLQTILTPLLTLSKMYF